MSSEQKEEFLSIIMEAYEKGMNADSMTAEVMVEELKEKIKKVLEMKEDDLVKI